MTANTHLAKAKDYIDRGDDFYEKAADEIVAAQEEDPTLSYRAIAKAIGRSDPWVRHIVKARTSAQDLREPWSGTAGEDGPATVRTLTRATPERMKQMLAELPPEQIEAVQTVAQDVAWDKSDAAETERSGLTPTGVRKQREASQQTGRRTLGVLDALIGIDKARAGLEAAVEALTEATPTDEEWSKFDWRLSQAKQAIEIIEAARSRTGDWDAALAELQS